MPCAEVNYQSGVGTVASSQPPRAFVRNAFRHPSAAHQRYQPSPGRCRAQACTGQACRAVDLLGYTTLQHFSGKQL